MTTPITPGLPPVAPAPQNRAQAAQRAFFQAAMERAGAPAPAVSAQAAPALAPAKTVSASATPEAATNETTPRPGRYLDIRV